jgi:hypothetical protein
MHRTGLRHLRPIVLTALYAALAHSGNLQQQKYYEAERARVDKQKQQPLHYGEASINWDMPPMPPRAIQLAYGINLPAVVVAVPILFGTRDELTISWAIGAFVPLLWFFVGRWFDRRVGWLPLKHIQAGSKIKIAAFYVCSVACGILAFFLFAELILEGAHHGFFFPLAAAIWLSFGAVCFFVQMNNQRKVIEHLQKPVAP